MNLFEKKPEPENDTENNIGPALLEQHENGALDDANFVKLFGKATVYYSTPAGDHKDGKPRLFALPAGDGTGYLPVFSSLEKMKEFYDRAGRLGYLIITGTFCSFLETIVKTNANAPVKMGAVIDPGSFGITLHTNMINTAITMIKQPD